MRAPNGVILCDKFFSECEKPVTGENEAQLCFACLIRRHDDLLFGDALQARDQHSHLELNARMIEPLAHWRTFSLRNSCNSRLRRSIGTNTCRQPTHALTHSLTPSPPRIRVARIDWQPLTHSLTQPLTHSRTYSLTHSLAHSLAHSLKQALTQASKQANKQTH